MVGNRACVRFPGFERPVGGVKRGLCTISRACRARSRQTVDMSSTPWRDGLAESDAMHAGHWPWIIGCLGLGAGGTVAARFDQSAIWLGLGLAIAGAAGAVWQFLYRRDLADRLLWLSWLLVLAAILWGSLPLIPGVEEPTRKDLASLMAFPGLIAGLVLAEQWLRRRDRQA